MTREYLLLIICLYVKDYLSDSTLEDFLNKYYSEFEKVLDPEIYLELISTNLDVKEKRISLHTRLDYYANKNFKTLFDNTNDAYIETFIDGAPKAGIRNEIVEALKERFAQPQEDVIDCSLINSENKLIADLKRALRLPSHCGNNWAAIKDFACEVPPPKVLLIKNIELIEKNMPNEAVFFKKILSEIDENQCKVIVQ